jgi:N-acetyl-anhydromuramyl-L-alanine amidase AmpD
MVLKPVTPFLAHRDRDKPPHLIVLHATAGATARSSIEHLRGLGLSYHYIIARDGRDSAKSETADGSDPLVFHCVPDLAHAFHVGSTVPAPEGGGIAKGSIGISLANIQRRTNPEPYLPLQLKALDELIELLKGRVPTLGWLTTHAAVQPWNRGDPMGMDGQAMAARHKLRWYQPSPAVIAAHRPK